MDGRYDSDFQLWVQEQAAALRQAALDRVNLPLDWCNLAEEIESMGRSERHEIFNRLTVLLEHLLKLAYSPDEAPRRGWRATVRTQRRALRRLLADSPSLRRLPEQSLAELFAEACEDAADDPSVRDLPQICPFDLDDEILNEDFFPNLPSDH